MADTVNKRGGLIVAVVVLAVVVAAIVLVFSRDDMRSTPVEDAVAGRTVTPATSDPTDSDPGLTPEDTRPQGKLAPDSNEGRFGAGSPETKRDTPALNPGTAPDTTPRGDTGRNAPGDPNNEAAQRVPRNDLESGANVDRKRSGELR